MASRRLILPPDLPLLADKHSRVIMLTASGEGLTAGSLSIVDRAPLAGPVGLDLRWLLESEGHLFARYALRQ